MGAHDFYTYADGETLHAAFEKATREARDEYGYDSYNGTISTVAGAKAIRREPVPLEVARRIAQERFDHYHEEGFIRKWEVCAAIPVAPEKHYTWRTKTFHMTVESDDSWLPYEGMHEAAKEKVPLAKGEFYGNIKWEAAGPPRPTGVRARNTEGDAVTRYYVVRLDGGSLHHDGCRTQAEARRVAEKYTAKHGVETGVIGKRVREDGGPLVKVQVGTVKHRVKVTVRIGKAKTTPTIKGWYFFGLAAS